MNDKLKKLYDLYVESGIIQTSSFEEFASVNDQQRKKLYDLGKQNGLFQTTDYNSFNSVFNVKSPVKKKSTTVSPSVQKKKPTSSGTMPSWMRSSLEQSSKKEQTPKKPVVPKTAKSSNISLDVESLKNPNAPKKEKQDFDIYYGYPGQEKNQYRISNGRWQRKYGQNWVDVSNPGSIDSLTKFFKKEKEILKDEKVFTGFPGKENNRYRISELQNGKKVWEVQRSGQKDYTVIADQGSIDALNRQFNKKIQYNDDAQSKREAQINRRESASEDFKTVTGKLVGKESDEVSKYLNKLYGNRGFRFTPVGWLTDRIRVSAEGTDRTEIFELDNWTDNTDSAEALKLRNFLSENQQLGDYIDLEREEEKKAEEAILGTELTKEDLDRQMSRLRVAGNQAEFKLAQKQNIEENITKGLNKNSTDVIEARKTLVRAKYDTNQRIDDLTKTAKTKSEKSELAAIAMANKGNFVETHKVDNEYINDLNKTSKALDGDFKQLKSDVDDFNAYIKENKITKEQLESDPELMAKKDSIQVRYDQLVASADEFEFESKKVPFIQQQNSRNAALYFAYNETRGSVIGSTWNGLVRGFLAPMQTFRVVDKEGLDNIVEFLGSSSTSEFAQSKDRNDLSRALLSTSESLGAAVMARLTGGIATEGTIASKALQFTPFFSISYNEMQNEINSIPGMNKVPWYKKEALSIAYGIGVGYLDKLSTDFSVKGKISNKIGRDLVLRSIAGLPKGATAEAIEMAIASNFKKSLAAGTIKIIAGSVVEGITEGVQSTYGTGLKEAYDWMNGVDEFDSREWISQALEETYYGALGGSIMSTPSALLKGTKDGFARLNPQQMELARKVIEDSNMRSMVITDIKTKLMSGEITKEEANSQMEAIKESQALFSKIPDNLSAESTSRAMDLIKERSVIEQQIQGKDKDLVIARTRRIAAINNELKTISENATKESEQQQQEVTAEGGGVQREGVVEGQPEVGQGEGTVGQTTEQGTDLSNRPVEGRSQEEIDTRVSELEAMLANDAASFEETGTGSLLPEAKTQIQSELEALKAEKPIEMAAEMPTEMPTEMPAAKAAPKITETTDTKTYSEALSEAKAALKAEGNGLDLQVSDVSQEEADAIVAEGGKIFMTEDGLAGAYVKKDGYMGGLFKNPKATYKEVAKLLQQARIKVGGRFMDAYATELERIYVNNGFRPVARLKFNEEYAPEGWDAPGSALASKPDVVFFAYDPEGKYSIGDGEYMTDYDAAYETAKNFNAKAVNEADKLAELMEGSTVIEGTEQQVETTIKYISNSEDVVAEWYVLEAVNNATKALRAILPNVKFVLHSTDESFREAVGETNETDSSRGAYDSGKKVIHINLTKANRRTVMHEVFHAIIVSKVSSDAKLQSLTKNMVKSVMKSLKQSGANQNVITYLEEFSAGYVAEEQNEEKLSELFALLGETYAMLPYPTQNIIQRFLDRVAKMFGLKEMTDREVVDFMNSLSGRVEAGIEISPKQFNGGKKVSKPSEGLTIKKQYGNDKVKVEVRYLEQERMDELIKNGLVQEVNNLSALNGQRVVTTSPDDMLVGSIYVNGKEVAIGNGGIFFVTKFGDVWANSNKGIAKGLASAINESSKANGGKAYLVLVKGSDAKLVSSPQGVTSSLAVTESMLDAGLFSLSDFRSAIRSAVKDAGGTISLSQNGSAKTLKNELDSFFSDVTASTFERRGNVLKAIIANLAKSESASKNKSEIIKFLNGDTSKGLGVGVTAKSQSLVDLVAKVSAEELTKGLNVGDIYGVIEINGEVDIFEDQHQSYPYHIKMVDKDGNVSSEKPILILPKNRKNGKDILTSIDGQTAEELGLLGFAGKVGATANLPYGKGIIQDGSNEVEDKSKIKKQKPLQPEVAEKLTEDGKGNYVFNHYSDSRRKTIKPGTGQNIITSREEGSALSAVGGIAQYYTMDMQKEPGTGTTQHTVLIPMDRVYYFNKDIENFYDEAKKRFEKVRPGQAFNPNYQLAFITQVANENGYDMVVANWRNNEFRAQTTMEITPSDKIIEFKPLKEVTYEVGDTVHIYGDAVKIVAIDGDVITYKNERTSGTFNFKRNPKGIYKIAIPKAQVEEEANELDNEVDTEKSNFKKQKPSKQADVIVKTGKDAGFSDAGIREYMKRKGYTDRQATDAIQAYNDKQEGIFIDPTWSKLRKAAVVFKRKFLSARGLMPNSAFALNENRQADIAKSLNMAEKNIADFNRAMKKVAKSDVEQVKKDFDAYVRGDKTIALSDDLKKIADTMRAHIDSMSEALINSGLVDEHTTEKINNNLGEYLTRSYKVYDRANWKKEVEDEIKQKAINFLKVQYTPMAQEIADKEGMDVDDVLDTIVTNKFNEILTKEGAENFITGGKLGSKNLSILKERQDIPLEIRMLMGEYTDTAQNYAKTVLKMSALAANHQFLTEVKKNGTGVFLFEKNDPRRPKGFDHMIAAEGSDTMNPLNGMYTTKEIGNEFEKQPSELGKFMELYMRALSLVKWGKTIGSLMTHAKNVFGNLGFVLLNGHWRVNEMGGAYKTVKNDLFSKDKAGLRDYMNRLIELGIVKQSAGIGELRAMFKDADWDTAMIERINKNTGSRWDWVKSKFAKGAKFMEDLYQSEDDFFKIVAYENELSRYSKAMFNKSKDELTVDERAEVDKVVAEIVKNTYPTYSRIPELVNMIRRFPFIGNFISFQAESYRTAFNTAILAKDEIKSDNPGVRKIGAQRLVGSITYMSAKTAILSAFSHAAGMGAVGILGYFSDDDDEKQKENDVRKFIAPWSKNSDLVILKAKNGKIQYIDFSSSDPHGGINKALNSALSGKTTIDGFINAIGSTIEPFVGEEMTTAAILAVKNNQDAYGKPIYNPEDTFAQKSKDIIAYMLNVVQPGTVSTMKRIYESESVLNEVLGASTGMRVYDVDVAENFGYSMITYRNRMEDAKRIYNSEVYSKDATDKSIADAKKRAENAITQIHKEIYERYYSAVRLGANEDVLFDKLKRFGRMSTIDMKFMFGEVPYLLEEKYAE